MATVADAITYARQKGQTDSGGISDTVGLAWANSGLIDITREYIKRNIDASQICESSCTVANTNTPPGRFAWPADMFMLKTISVNYTDTNQNNYIQANKVEISNLQGKTSVDFIRLNQSQTDPLFTNHGDTGEIFPTPSGTASIKIFYYLAPTEYSTVGTTIAYPESLDYRILGDKILECYYQSLENFGVANEWGAQAVKKINDSVQILAPQSQQPTTPQPLFISGFQF
jgi:hypothetical protein